MTRKVAIILIGLILIASSAFASPALSVISTYSSSSWLPGDINIATCKMVDDYLADYYFAVVFDGEKAQNRKDLGRKISQADGSYVVSVELRSFYDPPYTKARLASDIKPTDTVATLLMDYSLYNAVSDQWVTGRIIQRSVFRDAAVPLDTACYEVVKQAIPKLSDQLNLDMK